MKRKNPELNKITRSMSRIFPALLIFAPLMSSAATITDSTTQAQSFSIDDQYIIARGVTIATADAGSAVTVDGDSIANIENNGTIAANGDGITIKSMKQGAKLDNKAGASIKSSTANGITVNVMGGTIDNAGSIIGKQNGILISDEASTIIINNSGLVEGDTALSSGVTISFTNEGTFKGNQGDGLKLWGAGNSFLTNTGTIEGTENGIIVSENAKAVITNTGLLKGAESAVYFGSNKNNSLTLDTGSQLDGDVFSTGSTGNTLVLKGSGSEDSNFAGVNRGDGFASLTMSGSAWDLTGNIDIIGAGDSIKVDAGKLTFAGDVKNSGNTLIANDAILQLGNGEKTGTLSGTLTNNGTLEFNQAADFTFATDITGTGSVAKTDAHTLTLTGNNSYSGDTRLRKGTTLVAEGATLGSQGNTATVTIEEGATFASAGIVNNNIAILNGGTLAAWSAVSGNSLSGSDNVDTINGDVNNSGTLQISGLNDQVGNHFTINGDYSGASGSQIVMNTTLGDDSSRTDHLTITGSSAGQSNISLTNIGGLGAQTINGIEVVSVGGDSGAAFTLSRPAVVGAWEYTLNKKSNGNWYLESRASTPDEPVTPDTPVTPDVPVVPDTPVAPDTPVDPDAPDEPVAPEVMAPEVGAYLGNYLAAQDMFLHKRDDRDQLTLRNGEDLNTWMYVKGRYHDNDIAGGKVNYDTTQFVMQVGSDFISKQMDQGVLHAGMMFGAGQAKTDATARYNTRSAQGKVDGVNVGLYATWQEDPALRTGSYIDTWTAFSWYHNTVNGDKRSSESYDSNGFAASLEMGHAWVVASENERTWKIEPQIQAIYSYLDQENHKDADGVRISTLDNDSVLGRVGVKSSYFDQKDVQAWQPYVAVNWLKGAGQNDIAFNGETFSNDTPDDRAQLELGVTGKLNETTLISLRASGEWGENSYDAYGGHILLNHRW